MHVHPVQYFAPKRHYSLNGYAQNGCEIMLTSLHKGWPFLDKRLPRRKLHIHIILFFLTKGRLLNYFKEESPLSHELCFKAKLRNLLKLSWPSLKI